VTIDQTSLYHYDPETKQQSMDWRHSVSSRPKNRGAKISWKSSRLDFFGIKTATSSLIIFQRARLSTRSIAHLYWCNWGTFWRKNFDRGKVTKGVLFLHDNVPAHRALATQEIMVFLGFQFLDNLPYYRDLDPSDYHLFPGLKKQMEVLSIFRPTRRSLLPRRPGCTDNLLNYFWVACKN